MSSSSVLEINSAVRNRGRDRRRFTLLDGSILVAGLAVGAALARGPVSFLTEKAPWGYDSVRGLPSTMTALVTKIAFGSVTAIPVLAALSVTFLVVRLRSPRPVWRRVSRQPGTVAAAAAVFGLVLSALMFAPETMRLGGQRGGWSFNLWTDVAEVVGLVVGGAWFCLLLSGRWRAERSWVDRLGRGLGFGWLGFLVMMIVSYWSD